MSSLPANVLLSLNTLTALLVNTDKCSVGELSQTSAHSEAFTLVSLCTRVRAAMARGKPAICLHSAAHVIRVTGQLVFWAPLLKEAT